MYDLKKIRSYFPMLKEGVIMQGKRLVFLDNCSTTFKPQCVIDAMNKYYTEMTANSHRGDYDLCYQMDVAVLEARKTIANFVNCEANEVVFTAGTTMSLNLIAYGYALKFLKEGDEILLSEGEHASNILPWYKIAKLVKAVVKFIPLNEKGFVTPDALKATISKKTKIVSLAHISNVLGYKIDIKSMTQIAHEYGAIMVVDGAQSVPHIKTDFKKWDIDFLAFSAHKMCGPTGIGALIGKKELLEKMDAFLLGGGMNIDFDTKCNVSYLESPAKFEAGTQNLAGILGFKAAVDFINEIGLDNIHEHEVSIKKYIVDALKDCDNIVIYNKDSDGAMITFNMKGVFAQDEATLLNSKGIAIRSGLHCAKVLDEFLKVPATCRASFYLYTSYEEADAFIDAIKNGGDILDAYFN